MLLVVKKSLKYTKTLAIRIFSPTWSSFLLCWLNMKLGPLSKIFQICSNFLKVGKTHRRFHLNWLLYEVVILHNGQFDTEDNVRYFVIRVVWNDPLRKGSNQLGNGKVMIFEVFLFFFSCFYFCRGLKTWFSSGTLSLHKILVVVVVRTIFWSKITNICKICFLILLIVVHSD